MLAGRVPANVAALVMAAEPGEALACRGHNWDLPAGDGALPRGVVSYYAAATLPGVGTLSDWLAQIDAMAQQDVASGALPTFYRPRLQSLGDATWFLPGRPLA